jgi:hypothetical protein
VPRRGPVVAKVRDDGVDEKAGLDGVRARASVGATPEIEMRVESSERGTKGKRRTGRALSSATRPVPAGSSVAQSSLPATIARRAR